MPNPIPEKLRFFLLSMKSLPQVAYEVRENPSLYILNPQYIVHLFTFQELLPTPIAKLNQSYPMMASNEYSMLFANCNPETSVSMMVKIEVYNYDPSKAKDYLSSGLTQLPLLFVFFSVIYLGFLGFWIYYGYLNKTSVHWIHLLMAGLLLMKVLNLICAAKDKHYVKV